MWWRRKKKDDSARDFERMRKVKDSQLALISAATSTADIAHDVTIKLRERLDDSLRQLEVTANILSDALIVCDDDGVINSFNPAAERIFGRPLDAVLGENITKLFCGVNGKPLTTSEVWECLRNPNDNQGLHDYQFRAEYIKGKRRNGDLFYIDGAITYLDRQDGTVIVMLLVKDVTTRMELQKQLHISETRYRSIFESNFDGILVVREHTVVAANPAITRMLGHSSESMITKSINSFFHNDNHRMISNIIESHLSGDSRPHYFVVKGVNTDGHTVEMLFTSALMYWEGKPASLIALKDITEIMKTINASK